MTIGLAFGSGLRHSSPAQADEHQRFLAIVGRIAARVDPNPSLRFRDVVELDGRLVVAAVDPAGRPQPVPDDQSELILSSCARYGPVSWSTGVADCLAIPACIGLPCDPSLAPPGLMRPVGGSMWQLVEPCGALEGPLVVWNQELRNIATIDPDADWLGAEGLSDDDVRQLNAGVHDFFEIAFAYDLVVRAR